jgi:hypothetical protein
MAFYLREDFTIVAPKFIQILMEDASKCINIKYEDEILPKKTDDRN